MGSVIFEQIVGWSGIALLGLLNLRCLKKRLFEHYPVFCAYAAYVFLNSVVALLVASKARSFYPTFYWTSEFVALLLGLGVTLEVFQKSFASYPGVRKLANTLVTVLGSIAILRFGLGGIPPQSATVIALERDLRAVQALMVAGFAGLVLYYAVPIGRNLVGIAMGYGLFISTSVFNLTLRSQFGLRFQAAWDYLQPLEYCLCVAIWLAGLWAFAPPPMPERNAQVSYDDLSRETEVSFNRVREHMIGRGVR